MEVHVCESRYVDVQKNASGGLDEDCARSTDETFGSRCGKMLRRTNIHLLTQSRKRMSVQVRLDYHHARQQRVTKTYRVRDWSERVLEAPRVTGEDEDVCARNVEKSVVRECYVGRIGCQLSM